jgi:hypothetical protein
MESPKPSGDANASRYLGLGMAWALGTLLFLWLGSWADKRLGTEPLLTLVGAFVGAAAGLYNMYYRLIKSQRKNGPPGHDK